jgi:hypothetical protein
MIAEYALEPEMVAAWGDRLNHRFFIREFGSGQGRLVSRYPKKWAKKVWESFAGDSEMDRKRLEELLARLQDTMVKRKDYVWDDTVTWLANASAEHVRHPFRAVLARNNPANRPEILDEDTLAASPCPGWDNPHGITVNRQAPEMKAAVEMMLARCRWVKFVDPHLSPGRPNYQPSLRAFFNILAGKRTVGPLESIEIHTGLHDGTANFLRESFQKITPVGLQVILYQWQGRPCGQRLHNRYILTNLGGVSFHHGLDTGRDGETDDLTRLDLDQYVFRCKQYDPIAPAFDQAAAPITITGTLGG